MEGSTGGESNTNAMKYVQETDFFAMLKDSGKYGVVCAVIVAIAIPVILSIVLGGRKKLKQRGSPVKVGGEVGVAMRNARSVKLVEVPWEGATTMAYLFEQACKRYSQGNGLGTRKVISRDFVTSSNGRKFEKLHLGEFQWETYGQILDRASNFASGPGQQILEERRGYWIWGDI